MLQEELRRGKNVAAGDKSEDDNEEEEIGQEGEVLNQVEERLFRAITKFGKRPIIDVGVFSGNLKPNELIDWINELDWREIEEERRRSQGGVAWWTN